MLALMMLALAGCSHGGGRAAPATGTAAAGGAAQSGAATGATGAAGGAANQACSGGLTGTEPGVVRVTCGGTATIHVLAGGTTKDFQGGECHAAGDVWSASAGVIIDATGTRGKYNGPPVDSVAVNNTATAGKGTIQLRLGGRNYFDLGNARHDRGCRRKERAPRRRQRTALRRARREAHHRRHLLTTWQPAAPARVPGGAMRVWVPVGSGRRRRPTP